VPPPLADWAQVVQVARLSDQTAEAASSYLRRFAELSPQARDALGIQLANAVAAEVSPLPPAGTPPAAYLSAVLAVRRAREQVRFPPAQGVPTSYAQDPPVPAPNQSLAAESVATRPVDAESGPAQPAAAGSEATEHRLAPPA
jgi:hypothetical protein